MTTVTLRRGMTRPGPRRDLGILLVLVWLFSAVPAAPAQAASGTLRASPEVLQVVGGERGQVTLTWSSDATTTVEVRVGSPSGTLFTRSGPGEHTATTGAWVADRTSFYLQDVSGGRALTADATLATVTVRVVTPRVTATPALLRAPPGGTTASTDLTWTSASAAVEVRVGGPAGTLFARSGGGTHSASTGPWVADGTTFFLQDTSGGLPLTAANTLATRKVSVVSGSLRATPNPVRVRDSGGPGSVTLTWASRGAREVEIRLGRPDGAIVARSGTGTASVVTGAWVTDGATFYLQDVTAGLPLTPQYTIATTRVAVLHPRATMSASPSPVPVWDGSGAGITTLSWSSTDVSAVELRAGAPSGPLVARAGPGRASTTTGKWVEDGTTFYLQDVSGGLPLTAQNTLTSTTVRLDVQPTLRPSIGANKHDLLLQYLGTASNGDGSTRHTRVTRAMAGKAIADAAANGLTGFRVSVTGSRPYVRGAAGHLDLWRTDPDAYWRLVAQMTDDLRRHRMQMVPVFVWNWSQFPAMTAGDTTRDLVTDPSSASARLLAEYVRQFVSRYRDDPVVAFYELTNELNLKADLDQVARTAADPTLPVGSAEVIGNITTAEMVAFTSRLAALVRAGDPDGLVSAGHSLPRRSAEHLRRRPEFSAQGADWTRDSRAQFETNLADIHRDMQIASVHYYNNGDHERFGITGPLDTGLLDVVKATTDRLGKRLFLGEVADYSPQLRDDPRGLFVQAVLERVRQLQVPYTMPWAWEFYQRNTYTTYDNRLTGNNVEPGYTEVLLERLRATNVLLGGPVPPRPSPDGTAPHVVLTWPHDDAHLSSPRTVVAVASDDGRAVVEVAFEVDGLVRARDATAPYSFVLDPASLPTGPHTIAAVARDAAGNTGRWSTRVTTGAAAGGPSP